MITRFFKFVEITTKSISILAFLTGAAYCWYHFGTVNVQNMAIFFIAMLLFDMTTTAINNFIDRRASGREAHFSTPVSLTLIFLMISTSIALGLYLTVKCGIFVLLLGMFCFAVGIFYTFGPAPISRTPYGEIASGSVMGYCIPILAIYVSAPEGVLLEFSINLPDAILYMNLYELIKMVIAVTPLALTIANIMLANNICDVENDIKIKRYTLPFYIGNKNAVRLFGLLYYIGYFIIAFASITGIVPVWCLLCLLTLIPVSRNIKAFMQKQIKSETFVLSVVNSLIINASFALLIAVGGLFS